MSEPEYLTAQQVSERIGVRLHTVYAYLSRGSMPEADLIYMRHPLWLAETIDEWRKNKHKRGRKRVKRGHRVRTKPSSRPRPPAISKNGTEPAGNTKRSKTRASVVAEPPKPIVSVISEQDAKAIAGLLRGEGHYVTTADILALANETGELSHERLALQRRVLAKVRGLKARKP